MKPISHKNRAIVKESVVNVYLQVSNGEDWTRVFNYLINNLVILRNKLIKLEITFNIVSYQKI